MINNMESKIEDLYIQECSLESSSFWKFLFVHETETVTSGLCYIEDLICTIFVHQCTRFVCFDRWLHSYDLISTNKVLLYN